MRRLEGLGQHDFVILRPGACSSRTVSTPAMYSSGVWLEVIGLGSRTDAAGTRSPARSRPRVVTPWPSNSGVAVALDRFALAVDIDDVVAKEELQVFAAGARQAERYWFELEKKVVAERSRECQLVVDPSLKLFG